MILPEAQNVPPATLASETQFSFFLNQEGKKREEKGEKKNARIGVIKTLKPCSSAVFFFFTVVVGASQYGHKS